MSQTATQPGQKTLINFMNKRKLAMVFSLILMTIAIGSIITKGLNFGIDFTGGYLIEAGYQEDANLDRIRACRACHSCRSRKKRLMVTRRHWLDIAMASGCRSNSIRYCSTVVQPNACM